MMNSIADLRLSRSRVKRLKIWTYKHSRDVSHVRNFIPYVNMISSGADTVTKELVVMFDKNDVVSKYTMREIKGTSNQGIIH